MINHENYLGRIKDLLAIELFPKEIDRERCVAIRRHDNVEVDDAQLASSHDAASMFRKHFFDS